LVSLYTSYRQIVWNGKWAATSGGVAAVREHREHLRAEQRRTTVPILGHVLTVSGLLDESHSRCRVRARVFDASAQSLSYNDKSLKFTPSLQP